MNIALKFTDLNKARLTLNAINSFNFAGKEGVIIHVAAVPNRKEIVDFCGPFGIIVQESDSSYCNSLSLLMKSAFSGMVREVAYIDEDYITKLMPNFDINDLTRMVYEILDEYDFIQMINQKGKSFLIPYNKWREIEKRCI